VIGEAVARDVTTGDGESLVVVREYLTDSKPKPGRDRPDQTPVKVNMQTPQQVIEKLRKLLRLATDKAATQGEAEAAMQKAQELALRYKIELAGIEHAERPAEEYTEERQKRRKTFQAKYVEWIIRKHFNVTMVYGCDGEMFVIGKPTDIAFAKWVMEFLEAEFPRLWIAYQRAEGCGQGARVNYFYGVYLGLDAKLTENKQRVEGEALIEAEINGDKRIAANYQLAVVNEKRELEAAMHRFHPKLRFTGRSTLNLRHGDAIAAGRSAGRNINIHRPLGGRQPSAGSLR
jgi:hypothetical protein